LRSFVLRFAKFKGWHHEKGKAFGKREEAVQEEGKVQLSFARVRNAKLRIQGQKATDFLFFPRRGPKNYVNCRK
jgi:hypothetical protein